MLAGIYRGAGAQANARASSIVFVPGIEGSSLVDIVDGRTYWGAWGQGAPLATFEPAAMRKLALPMELGTPISKLKDTLKPGATLLDVTFRLPSGLIHVRGYQGVFEGLLTHLQTPDAKLEENMALPVENILRGEVPIREHAYDWRHDISLEAANLHKTVLAVIARSQDPDHRVDLVGHSMGSLLVRWYLRYGPQPLPDDGSLPRITWEGARYVRRALIVAPPNGGSVGVLEALLHGEQANWLLPKYPAAMLGTFPSTYQLLPSAPNAAVDGKGRPIDLFDVDSWDHLGWGLLDPGQAEVLAHLLPDVADPIMRRKIARDHVDKLLRRAKAFQAALDVPATPPPSMRMHLFAGDNYPTPAAVTIVAGQITVARLEPGDGRVTRRSALRDTRDARAPGRLSPIVDWHSVHFADADHAGITASPEFLDDALYLLLDAPDPILPGAP